MKKKHNSSVLERQGGTCLLASIARHHQGTTNRISVQFMDANRATNDEQNGFTAESLGIG